MSTMARDSGAGAYSKAAGIRRASGSRRSWSASVEREVVGPRVAAGGQLLALHQQVVEQRRGAEAEPVGVEPVLAAGLVHHHQVADRVLGRADAARRLDAHLAPGLGPEVAHRLEHHEGDWRGGGGGGPSPPGVY